MAIEMYYKRDDSASVEGCRGGGGGGREVSRGCAEGIAGRGSKGSSAKFAENLGIPRKVFRIVCERGRADRGALGNPCTPQEFLAVQGREE